MEFRYQVGETVQYKAVRASVAHFIVVRRMPQEFHDLDRRYLIKSVAGGSERNVMECDLSPGLATPE
jgi:hypothetical protein